MQFKTLVQTPDGVIHESKEAAQRHMRAPAIKAALLAVAGGQRELADKLFENEENLVEALDAGTLRMVTKAERKELAAALEIVVAAKLPKTDFIIKHSADILAAFRWPAQKRLTPEEKVVAQLAAVSEIFDGREDVAGWVVQEKDKILAAFKAGQPERKLPASANEGLALYQAMKTAEKALKAATLAFETEATPENQAAMEAANVAYTDAKRIVDERKAAKQQAENA